MTGLVRATAPQIDVFFVLYEGQVSSAESVFSTVSGLASGLPNLRQFLDPAKSCQIVYYHPRLESASYQAFRLRMAIGIGLRRYWHATSSWSLELAPPTEL
jgi:hypothetical protein